MNLNELNAKVSEIVDKVAERRALAQAELERANKEREQIFRVADAAVERQDQAAYSRAMKELRDKDIEAKYWEERLAEIDKHPYMSGDEVRKIIEPYAEEARENIASAVFEISGLLDQIIARAAAAVTDAEAINEAAAKLNRAASNESVYVNIFRGSNIVYADKPAIDIPSALYYPVRKYSPRDGGLIPEIKQAVAKLRGEE